MASTKKELITKKNALAYQIRNINEDYSGVSKEDWPQEVIDEVVQLMAEMREVRGLLGKE